MSKEKKKVLVYKVDLENVSVSIPENITQDIKQVIHTAFIQERKNSSCEISVILTSDKYITELNKKYLDREYPTDVLCFPYSTGKHYSSDIFISVERAREQAKRFNHTIKHEILFLVLHALLHLFGWRDNTEESRKKMCIRQEQLMRCL